MAELPQRNLDELRSYFSPSVRSALESLDPAGEITPAELIRELADVHPKYGQGRLGKAADLDPTVGPRLPVAELLQRVLSRHDIEAMRQAGDVIHTRSVVLDLAALFPEIAEHLGQGLLDAVRSEITREFRPQEGGESEPALARGQVLSPSMERLVPDARRRAAAGGSATVDAEHLAESLAVAHGGRSELVELFEFFGASLPARYQTPSPPPPTSAAGDVSFGASALAVFHVASGLAASVSIDPETRESYLRLRDLLGGLLYAHTGVKDELLGALSAAGAPTRQILDTYPTFLAEPYTIELKEFLTQERHLAPPRAIDLPPDIAAMVRGTGEAFAGFVHDDTRDPGRDLLESDRLNIAPHVRAFALLMASKDLRPPLATGLFGDWGSGKTYFMRALRQEIDRITREARHSGIPQRELPVYRNIAQIEFNAWHYVDSEIWASLADYIFTNLKIEESESIDDVERRRQLYVDQLREKGAALRQVETDRMHLENRIEQAEMRLARIERDKAQQIGLLDVARATVEVESHTQRAVNDLASQLGIPQVTRAADEVKTSLREARDTVVRGNTVLETLSGRYGGRWLLLALIALLAGPVVLLVSGAFDWSNVNRVASSLAAFLAGAAGLLRTATAATSDVLTRITALDREVQKRIDTDEAVLEHRRQVDELDGQRAAALEEEEELKQDLKEIEAALERLTPGRLLADFILSRQDSDDYRKHLGLASLIRRDFDELTLHIREFNESLEVLPPDTEHVRPAPSGGDDEAASEEEQYHVNRIVLYIDDLDRCPPDMVVQVLQAVHLLLYFPLFVVVVGVDARWLARSLQAHYHGLLTGTSDGADPITSYARSATPHDYLEKIFQIPFWLRPMPRTAQSRLLTSLTGQAYVDQAVNREGPKVPEPPVGDQASAPADAEVVDRTSGETQSVTGPDGGEVDEDSKPVVQPYSLRIDQISVSEDERAFMENIRPLLGRSPRSLTRFVNVYRLTKAVARNEGVGGGRIGDLDEQQIAMFLLAIVTGLPTISSRLFSELAKTAVDVDATLGEIVADIEPDRSTDTTREKPHDQLAGEARARLEWREVAGWLEQHPDWAAAKLSPRFREEQGRSWLDWANRVARYSYRLEQT